MSGFSLVDVGEDARRFASPRTVAAWEMAAL